MAYRQRTRRHAAGPGVSLFPFLAVLICTMGALVPLFLAIARQARLQATRDAATKAAQWQVDMKADRELSEWRLEQLKVSRKKTETQLTEARWELGHLEDHSRRLREQLAQLQATWDELDKHGAVGSQQRGQLETELQQVRAEIAQAQQQLGDAQRTATERNRPYAVVPYEGPNQTHRTAIYLECRADAVVLQPEGIRLEEDDFEGPLGPGNPLAATLRATREYLISHAAADPARAGEPYPLLLVRPEGIAAYYAARAAMKSWGPDFGYELIGDDWKLAFPRPDPQLVEVVREALDAARAEQQRLIAAAPRSYGRRSRPVYRAAPGNGGSELQGGSGDEDDRFQPRMPAPRVANRSGPYCEGSGSVAYPAAQDATRVGSGGLSGRAPAGGTSAGSPGQSGFGPSDGTLAGNPNSGGGGPGGAGYHPRFGSGEGDTSGSSGSGATSDRYGASAGDVASAGQRRGVFGSADGNAGGAPPNGPASSSANRYGSAGSGAKQSTATPEGVLSIGPEREPSPSSGDARKTSADRQAMALRPGEWYPQEDPPPEPPEKKDAREKADRRHKNLAEKRGKDWGLPEAAGKSVPITRPIHIRCEAQQLTLLPEPGFTAGKSIPLGARTEESIDELVSSIWSHMQSWGIAGKGMYWRPVLQVHVAADAVGRYQDLQMLLEGSGLRIERKE